MRYVTADRIRAIDRRAQEAFGIPSIVLMENAGIAACEEILSFYNGTVPGAIAVVCGKGNNGGDGFVVARQLLARGARVDVILVAPERSVKREDPRANLRPLRMMGARLIEVLDGKGVKRFRRRLAYAGVVDAIFGTGFSGAVPEHVRLLISALNESGAPIFSIDVPSGLDATTGAVVNACIRATITVTFGLPKTGFVKGDGPRYAGKVVTRNISYPEKLLRV